MTEISNIRNLYFEEGKNNTEINRITGKDRKTIKIYIDREDWNKPELSERMEKQTLRIFFLSDSGCHILKSAN